MKTNSPPDQCIESRAGVITPPPPLDLKVAYHGTIVLFHPLTAAARDWLGAHCPAGDEHQYFGHALAVERRYAEDLLAMAENDGLNTVQRKEAA